MSFRPEGRVRAVQLPEAPSLPAGTQAGQEQRETFESQLLRAWDEGSRECAQGVWARRQSGQLSGFKGAGFPEVGGAGTEAKGIQWFIGWRWQRARAWLLHSPRAWKAMFEGQSS